MYKSNHKVKVLYRKHKVNKRGSRGAARACLLYTSPSPRDKRQSRMPSSA